MIRTAELIAFNENSLTGLVRRAANQLASATTAAEILEARDSASVAYDASKKAARLARAKGAHDELIAKAHRTQADALEIEAGAKRRLADEYDAAQERGEIRRNGERSFSSPEKVSGPDILDPKDIHEARIIRDAENAQPGIVRRALDARLAQGQEPNKAALREAVVEAARIGMRGGSAEQPRRNPLYKAPSGASAAWTHVYGQCRALVEWATDENVLLALHGKAERLDDQSSNIAAIQKAHAVLTQLLEGIHAQ